MVHGISNIDDAIRYAQEHLDAATIAKKNIVNGGIIEGHVMYAAIIEAIERVFYGNVMTDAERALWGVITTDWEEVYKNR